MRILIGSQQYYPIIGGIPVVTHLLAAGLAKRHDVRLLTAAVGVDDEDLAFELIRKPSPARMMNSYAWADVVLLQGPTIWMAWPLLFLWRKPYAIIHHIWLPSAESDRFQGWLRSILIRGARNLCVSKAVGEALQAPYEVLSNPYDSEVFRLRPHIGRTEDLVFVGRLVREKGVHQLLDALVLLGERGLHPRLTVVGVGEELDSLRCRCLESSVGGQVTFAGQLAGEALAAELNRHRILVVPSVWDEPFGIVALEGIACGCVVVGSSRGGLADAIGSCGITYPNGNVRELASSLEIVLTDQEVSRRCLGSRNEHLRRFDPSLMVSQYERLIKTLADRIGA